MLKSVLQFVKGYAWFHAVGAIVALFLLIFTYIGQSPIVIILSIAMIIGIFIYILKKT